MFIFDDIFIYCLQCSGKVGLNYHCDPARSSHASGNIPQMYHKIYLHHFGIGSTNLQLVKKLFNNTSPKLAEQRAV